MNIKPIGSNQTEARLDNGTVVLFSYSTPVAAYNLRPHDRGGFAGVKVNRRYSNTTTRHINAWGADKFSPVSQAILNGLASGQELTSDAV